MYFSYDIRVTFVKGAFGSFYSFLNNLILISYTANIFSRNFIFFVTKFLLVTAICACITNYYIDYLILYVLHLTKRYHIYELYRLSTFATMTHIQSLLRNTCF